MKLTVDGARCWGATESERRATYPCEAFAAEPYQRYLRAVEVDADPAVTFRWVCQLKVAPYSYDWIDNLGRRSPRQLTAGTDELAPGQRFMIGRIVDFEAGRHITAVSTPGAARLFGPDRPDLPGRSPRRALPAGRRDDSHRVVTGRSATSSVAWLGRPGDDAQAAVNAQELCRVHCDCPR